VSSKPRPAKKKTRGVGGPALPGKKARPRGEGRARCSEREKISIVALGKKEKGRQIEATTNHGGGVQDREGKNLVGEKNIRGLIPRAGKGKSQAKSPTRSGCAKRGERGGNLRIQRRLEGREKEKNYTRRKDRSSKSVDGKK